MSTEMATLGISVLTLVVALIIGIMQIIAAKKTEKIDRLEEENKKLLENYSLLKGDYKISLNDLNIFFKLETNLLEDLATLESMKVQTLKIRNRKRENTLALTPGDVLKKLANLS